MRLVCQTFYQASLDPMVLRGELVSYREQKIHSPYEDECNYYNGGDPVYDDEV